MSKIQSTTIHRDLNVELRETTQEMLDNRQVEFVISSESVDAHGTVFRMSGWDLSRFNSNPVVLYGHRSSSGDPDDVIGSGEVFKEDKELIGRVTFEDGDNNPKAEKVYQKVLNNLIRMTSIGALVHGYEWGDKERGEDPDVLYFTKQELVEFSIVPIGSNPDALKREKDVTQAIRDSIKKEDPKKQDQKDEQNNEQLSVREAQIEVYKYNQK